LPGFNIDVDTVTCKDQDFI